MLNSQFVRRARAILAGIPSLVLLGLFFLAPALRAQQPEPSVAEAARIARQLRKQQAAPHILWTNDNIPKEPGTISIVGQPAAERAPSPSSDVSSPATAAPVAGAADAARKSAGLQGELQQARDQLASLRTDLNLLVRELSLDQKQFYGNPDYSRDSEGKARLDGEAARITLKSDEVKVAEARVAALEKQLAEPPLIPPPLPSCQSFLSPDISGGLVAGTLPAQGGGPVPFPALETDPLLMVVISIDILGALGHSSLVPPRCRGPAAPISWNVPADFGLAILGRL